MKYFSRILMFILVIENVLFINAQSLSGTTWSYTTRVYGSGKINSVTTYFHFSSPTNVIWLLGTPDGIPFPVAIGKYNPSTNKIIFSALKEANQYSELFKMGKDVIFEFQFQNNTMKVLSGEAHKHGLMSMFYNDFQQFVVVKETLPFQPSTKMIGQSWGGYTTYDGEEFEYVTISFKTQYEAEVSVERDDGYMGIYSCPYIILGNIVAIHYGDHFVDKAQIGYFNNENEEMRLCMYGIFGKDNDWKQPCINYTPIK